MEKKKKGSGKVLIAIGAVLVALAVAVVSVGMYFEGVLNTYVGMGEAKVVAKPGSENWDSEYYKADKPTADEVDVIAKDVTKRIAEEGITLMKNNGVLPLAGNESVSLFGRRSVDTVWGGTGSGAGDAGQCTPIAEAFTAQGFKVNDTLTKLYADNLDKVPTGYNAMDKLPALTFYIGEFPMSYYTGAVTGSYASYKDAAFVVIGRSGGEGMDLSTDLKGAIASEELAAMTADHPETANYADGQHSLELTYEEKELLKHVEENFDKVIVIVNSANVMELGELEADENVDAIVWLAYPGSRGNVALAEIVAGAINPSGHTVDTWPADLTKDPTFANAVVSTYTNTPYEAHMIEYEEGIYVGYRYYETAAAEGFIDYDSAVVYPFGYGLSYTTFEQKINEAKEENGEIVVTVDVTNAGAAAGKDVVQVYYHAPYTKGGIEKAEVVLANYVKTDLLQPGETKTYTVSFNVEDMASFDYKGEGCYVLEAGDYVISVRKNAHEVYGEGCEWTYSVPETVVYNESNPRATEVEAQTGELVNYSDEWKQNHTVVAATTRFGWMNEHFEEGKATILSRADFAGTFPTAPTAADLIASDALLKQMDEYKPDYYDSSDVAPTTGADNKINAIALRGATYDDPRWEKLLDQLSVKDMTNVICAGNQGTVPVGSIGLPKTNATDGPAGLKQYGGIGFSASGNFNCCGTLVAATYNVDLAEEYGNAVGNEAVLGGVDGWYAPGNDLHRTPFCGRNFEYYSEDPVVAGKTCGGTIQGAINKGFACFVKHFALNDIEMYRDHNGPAVWSNEQAMRELNLKAFELCIKNPVLDLKYLDEEGNVQHKLMKGSIAVMSSFNRLGGVWTGGCGELLNDVLRGEWGFLGCVITDYNGTAYMNCEWGVSNGNDLMLANISTLPSKFADISNPSTQKVMRQAVKNIAYMTIHSNAANGLSDGSMVEYGIAPWKLALFGLGGVLVLGGAALIVLGVLKGKKKSVVKIEKA